jgi:hypothetical protein
MTKFKVGDKVRVTELIDLGGLDAGSGIRVGDKYNVIAVHSQDKDYIGIDFKLHCRINGIMCYPMRATQLELVKEDKVKEHKYKVGDKVRVVSEANPFCSDVKVGDIGKINSLSVEHMWIQFDTAYQTISAHRWDSLEPVSKKEKPKTELRIVYKVVTQYVAGAAFESYSGRGDITLTYRIGHKTKTPKGWNPLFAFDTLEQAHEEHPFVLKCVAKVRVDDTDFSFMNLLPAKGTVLCDWVFPIEQVKR